MHVDALMPLCNLIVYCSSSDSSQSAAEAGQGAASAPVMEAQPQHPL